MIFERFSENSIHVSTCDVALQRIIAKRTQIWICDKLFFHFGIFCNMEYSATLLLHSSKPSVSWDSKLRPKIIMLNFGLKSAWRFKKASGREVTTFFALGKIRPASKFLIITSGVALSYKPSVKQALVDLKKACIQLHQDHQQ